MKLGYYNDEEVYVYPTKHGKKLHIFRFSTSRIVRVYPSYSCCGVAIYGYSEDIAANDERLCKTCKRINL